MVSVTQFLRTRGGGDVVLARLLTFRRHVLHILRALRFMTGGINSWS